MAMTEYILNDLDATPGKWIESGRVRAELYG
jgi:hypothetical protein